MDKLNSFTFTEEPIILMNEQLKQIAEQQGWAILSVQAVPGGDINQAYCIITNTGKFFVKINDAKKFPKMFEKEAAGLTFLQKHFTLKVPVVIAVGEINGLQFLVLEWLQSAIANNQSWQVFGSALAGMHKTTNQHFGWQEDTYIASIVQTNTWCKSWPKFYGEQRIMPLVKQLHIRNSLTAKDVQHAEAFCNSLAAMIPDEPPALLHGDLWSGNVMAVSVSNQVTTAIYDPDAFYGHRETDIAMTRLFGGFPMEFYTSYDETYPLQKGWEQRFPIFQLYPLLVHAVLFGGGYINRVKTIISS